jgi:predicted PurR-regulated permease PerM
MKEGEKVIHISTETIIKSIIIVVFCYLLFYLRDVVLVILTSIVLSSSIEPGVRWFERRKIPRLLGVVFIYAFVALLVAVVLLSLIPIILKDMSGVIESIPIYVNQINNFIPVLNESLLQGYVPLLREIADNVGNASFIKDLNNNVGGTDVLGAARTIAQSMITVILTFVLSFYFSVTKDGVAHFLRIITPIRYEEYVIDLWNRTKEKIGAWMQGQIVLAVIVGFLVYSVLAIFKIKHALVLGILSAFFELIPVFGPVLSAIPGIALTLLDKGLGLALVITLWYIIVQQLENNLLYPAVVKKIVGISPLLVILALIIGAKLAGLIGIILSVPVSVLLIEFIDDIDRKKNALRKNQ